MRKSILSAAVLLSFTLSSYAPVEGKSKVMTGTYGVCNCGENASDVTVELSILPDSSFHYLDNSKPLKKIDVRGKWTLEKGQVVLKKYQSDFAIQDKWTIDKNGKCLQSRKGLAITRLCHLQACN